ncbi:MAG TPA: hypothetical protein ENF87_02895 [Thermoproteales archaeon]|nr:hypothetical protein [Thermoproteales archaeon]
MTGPAPGKIPLISQVYLGCGLKKIKVEGVDVYLHVKGWSLARVTHLDIEHPVFNQIVKPKRALYLEYKSMPPDLVVFLDRGYTVKYGSKIFEACFIELTCNELAKILGKRRGKVYVGGKVGGVFLGFHKEEVTLLEKLAIAKGVKPRHSTIKD